MEIHYISRKEYRKNIQILFKISTKKIGRFYQIPEGGTNKFVIQGTD